MKIMETIYLSQKEFDALPNYSCSFPTGQTVITTTFEDGRMQRTVLPGFGM
jgi:flavin reductase (DIM6/NTAB) family NADH-FMN oxidoreductase RutF